MAELARGTVPLLHIWELTAVLGRVLRLLAQLVVRQRAETKAVSKG